MERFIQWIRPSFEGNDGKASSRKISMFFLLSSYLLMILLTAKGAEFEAHIWFSVETMALTYSGLSTYQNVKQNKINDGNEN